MYYVAICNQHAVVFLALLQTFDSHKTQNSQGKNSTPYPVPRLHYSSVISRTLAIFMAKEMKDKCDT